MLLNDHFDVANLVGHPAFESLAQAINVYDEARQTNLLDITTHSWPDCLGLGAMLSLHRRAELKHCVQAVILFQAMMEKVPYFVPSIGSGITPTTKTTFAGSWKDLLSQISNPQTQEIAKVKFNDYHSGFYKEFRNPIVHGRKAIDIGKVNKIKVAGVYQGMCQGWRAYDYLLTEVFAPVQRHEPSWDVMCSAHHIPNSINSQDYPDLEDMERQFMKKHLDGTRGNAES